MNHSGRAGKPRTPRSSRAGIYIKKNKLLACGENLQRQAQTKTGSRLAQAW